MRWFVLQWRCRLSAQYTNDIALLNRLLLLESQYPVRNSIQVLHRVHWELD